MASLMPVAKQQYFIPGTTIPLVGGKLWTYAAGTSNPKPTYQDAAGTIPNTNPITLDSSGSALIFWDGAYKIVLKDGLGNTIYTVDNYVETMFAVNAALSALQLSDYAALRSYSGAQKNVFITGYLVTKAPSGIGGMFVRDDSDITSADNGGTIIVAANGKRWKRAFSGPANVLWFGAAGDWDGTTGTDDTAAVQRALNAHAHLYFPTMCRVTADITVSQPYPVLTGDGKYGACGIVRTGGGAGKVLTFSDTTVYPKMSGLYVRCVPWTISDYFNTGTVGIDITSASTSIDMEDVWVRGCEKLVAGSYNGFYNRFFNCRFEETLYPLFGMTVNNLNVQQCRFKGFMDAITLNGTGGPANIIGNWFEVFNGRVVSGVGDEQGHVNVERNYVETYDTVNLPTNFPQAPNGKAGKFGGNVLFSGSYSTLNLRDNDLSLGGVYIIASLSKCDHFVSENHLHLYGAGNNLLRMYNLPTLKSCMVKDRVGASLGANGGYAVTYDQQNNIPLLADVYGDFSFYDAVLDKHLLCPSKTYAPTVENGWTNDGGPDGVPAVTFTLEGLPLQGVVTGTARTGDVIWTLPPEKRPLELSQNRAFCFLTTHADEGSGPTVQLRYLYNSGQFRLENAPASTSKIVLDGLLIPTRV